LIVNDGSKDGSKEVLEDFGDKIVLLNHMKNRGQGAALETGFEYLRRY
jgi:glycosyltransferase involved in cell wall biosynthesis